MSMGPNFMIRPLPSKIRENWFQRVETTIRSLLAKVEHRHLDLDRQYLVFNNSRVTGAKWFLFRYKVR